MTKLSYFCDICGVETKPNASYSLRLTKPIDKIQFLNASTTEIFATPGISADLCSECAEKLIAKINRS